MRSMNLNIEELLERAKEFATEAGNHTLTYFRKHVDIIFKGDASPVTIADQEAEQILRNRIIQTFPHHGILGEEYGAHLPESDVQWILDPIDGTQSFIHGIPLYTTLVGILVKGKPLVGVVYAPAMAELLDAADGLGTRLNGIQVNVRSCKNLSEATVLTTDLNNISKYDFEEPHQSIMKQCRIHRTWGDAYGHLMVASGRADIMVDPILNIWDAAPLTPILREAGGIFMDRFGNENLNAGHGISVGPDLKDEVVRLLNR
jgi:histidinol-phosphatase